MKRRQGFVSNSSSSSFCMIGTCFSIDEVEHPAIDKENWWDSVDGDAGIYKVLEIADIDTKSLSILVDEDGDAKIGFDMDEATDDETLGSIKERMGKVVRRAFEVLGLNVKKDFKLELMYGDHHY